MNRLPLKLRKVVFLMIWPFIEVGIYLYEDYLAIKEGVREYRYHRPRIRESYEIYKRGTSFIRNYKDPE